MLSLLLIGFALIVGACGDDSTADPVGADPSNQTATDTDPLTPAPDQDPSGEPSTGASAGTVTVGDQTWEFDSRQCSVYAADTVSVLGNAVSDPNVEITFDVFGEGEFNLEVDDNGTQWTAGSDSMSVTVDGSNVSGTATVGDMLSGGSEAATFEFHCG